MQTKTDGRAALLAAAQNLLAHWERNLTQPINQLREAVEIANAEAEPKLTEAAPALLAAVKAMLPWLGKLIADGGHLNSVLPGAAVRTMDGAQALVDRIEAPDPVFEPLVAQADYMDQQRAARRAKK